MKQVYIAQEFRSKSKVLISKMNEIIGNYMAQGYTLTVRQLYYQLVARDAIENNERSYKNITSLVNDARMAGLMDWEAIEDRTREVTVRPSWGSASDILDSAASSFHMDLWQGQDDRFIVIVEKEALAGVIGRVCREYNLHMLAARGYPSVTVLRDLALSTLDPWVRGGHDVHILHFGDHDPSGLDMTRDLRDRIELFMPHGMSGISLRRMALNFDQIEKYDPPPNPAKSSDSRFADYQQKHGDESWELDALEPKVISALVSEEVEKAIDFTKWEARKSEIEHWRDKITDVAQQFRDDN